MAYSHTLLFSEILDKVHKAKTKVEKVAILITNDSESLRMLLKASFDPTKEWVIPEGEVPYTPNEAPIGTDHNTLHLEAKKLYLFIKGGDATLSQTKREMLFIQMLEGLSKEEAEFLIAVKDNKINNLYKGFTGNLVKEAFGWDDNYMKIEQKSQ